MLVRHLISPALALGLGLHAIAFCMQAGADQDAPAPSLSEARTTLRREKASVAFGVADHNGDAWISFREARQSLDHDRTRFHAYDSDGDGRITLPEFTERYLRTLQQVGAFPPPTPSPDPKPEPAPQLEPEPVLAPKPEPERAPQPPAPASEIRALTMVDVFGEVEARPGTKHSTPEPNRIPGPVPAFRRLDYDNDGGITRSDLIELGRGTGLDVRVNTILSVIDTDRDGAISEAEFYASMGSGS
jgi:Ca2+-binding EF-hand superfamily protein